MATPDKDKVCENAACAGEDAQKVEAEVLDASAETEEQKAEEPVDELAKAQEEAGAWKDNGETGLLGGVSAVHSKFKAVFEKEGVEVIDPKGEAFNALEAQAVATVDDPSVPDETVAEVYQKGYRMGNKVIRNAMVTVTVGGPKRESEEEED